MKRSYLDYAMSVIVARALPDVRDGLKPVQRRILYAMKDGGFDWNRPYRKSANIVGEVLGRYHPHGNQPIYDAMVRMAQDFSMRLPFIDGQGNFGSMDGDPPAAMRYTEARLQRVASEALLADIDKDTVEFQPNYDESTQEPTVLPAGFPNILVNGAGGIAVGMATNIPPHNLGEVIDACNAYIDDPNITIDGLMEHVPGPDFPTGAIVMGRAGIRDGYHTGRGAVRVRAKVEIEELRKDREAIVVTEVPYLVNKARMIERIAEVVREKTVEGVSDIRDESDRHGLRVVIELRRDAESDVVLNQLYRYTPLQTAFGMNMVAINGGRPETLDLKQIISAFVAFREEVITRRTIFDLGKARDRAHVLVGLAIAVANIDEVIALIRAAPDPVTAREGLMARAWPASEVAPLIALIDEPGSAIAEDGTIRLSDAQARAILELRLQRLTGLEREKIAEEMGELAKRIREYLEILDSREKLMALLRAELDDMKARFATPRRTVIEETAADHDDEDLIQREDMVVTVSHGGYIKRVPLSMYRAQRRGGKGRAGMATRDKDFVNKVFVCNTHTPVLFFSSRGMVYKLKVYRLPLGSPQARGKALINLLPLRAGETITVAMPLPEDETTWESLNLLFATARGYVRPISLSKFKNIYARGLIAIKLEADDHLIGVRPFETDADVLLATARGKCIRFALDKLRLYGSRDTVGVQGIRPSLDDTVISMTILRHVDLDLEERDAYLRYAAERRRTENGDEEAPPCAPEDLDVELSEARLAELVEAEQFILSVADDGLGKRTSAYEYRVMGRGNQGIASMELARSGGREARVAGVYPVGPSDQLVLVTDGGKLIRCPVDDIRIAGRATRGVRLFDVAEDERVVSVARLADEGEAAAEDEPEGDEPEGDEPEGDEPEGGQTDGLGEEGGGPEPPA